MKTTGLFSMALSQLPSTDPSITRHCASFLCTLTHNISWEVDPVSVQFYRWGTEYFACDHLLGMGELWLLWNPCPSHPSTMAPSWPRSHSTREQLLLHVPKHNQAGGHTFQCFGHMSPKPLTLVPSSMAGSLKCSMHQNYLPFLFTSPSSTVQLFQDLERRN